METENHYADRDGSIVLVGRALLETAKLFLRPRKTFHMVKYKVKWY